MNCPRCAKPLHEFLSQGVLIDYCTSCKGTWLDAGEARFFAADPKKVEAALSGELLDAKKSPISCPRCAGSMTEGGVFDREYRIDRCDACAGIWFDAKELTRLSDARFVGSLDPAKGRNPRPSSRIERPADTDGGSPVFAMTGGGGMAGATAAELSASLAPVAIPNLFVRSAGVLGSLVFILGFLFVTASTLLDFPPIYGVAFTLLFAGFQFLVGPFFLDFFLRWTSGMHWVERSQLPTHLASFLDRACRKNGIGFPRIGVIEDGSPNAFTYGHHPGNARVVVTRGLLDVLTEEEVDAVVAHELGHVKHWDAAVMTLAGTIPILCWALYRSIVRMSQSNRRGRGAPQLLVVAIVAYVLYTASQYLVLLLSRTREYWADRFSAEETRNPNALAMGLVKVAYGLVETSQAAAQAQPGRLAAAGGGMRAFGIFDPGAARQLAAASYAGGAFSRDNLVGAMQWDLWNPWAKWFEIHSTHPLPAKRLQALAAQAVRFGQVPLIVFDKEQPESFWDEFAVDLFIKFLPWILAPVLALFAFALLSPAAAIGAAVLGFGIGYLGRVLFTYHLEDGYSPASVAALLKVVKVSPVRGVPAELRGTVIGRGTPGFILSEDVTIQDKTGILFMDYNQPLAIFNWWFALARVPEIMGKEVVARGWYRRGPAPYFEVREINYGGKSRKSYVYPAKLAWGVILSGLGLLLTFGGFLAAL